MIRKHHTPGFFQFFHPFHIQGCRLQSRYAGPAIEIEANGWLQIGETMALIPSSNSFSEIKKPRSRWTGAF
jgi:hypothetical protein